MNQTADTTTRTDAPVGPFGTVLVTGGAGFTGRRVIAELLRRGHTDVRVLDLDDPGLDDPRVTVLRGSLSDGDLVDDAMGGVDSCFHLAAVIDLIGMAKDADRARSFDANVDGTRNVVEACKRHGVARLIHTSSNNVGFAGTPVRGGDETLPYPTSFIDLYTETKVIAEQDVLAANGVGGLQTVALRPGGIYGPGEKMMFTKTLDGVETGQNVVGTSGPDVRTDYIYVDNLVHAQMLAAQRLLEPDSPAGGEAYFVTDDEPMSVPEFFGPILHEYGFETPRVWLPRWLLYLFAWLSEFAYRYLGGSRPMVTRIEVDKVTMDNWHRIDKARRDLGYEPVVPCEVGLAASLEVLKAERPSVEHVTRPAPGWWIVIVGGMTSLGLLAFSTTIGVWWRRSVTARLSPRALRAMFGIAVLLHIGEATFAHFYAKRNGLGHAVGQWTFQTLVLGFPSTRALVDRVRARRGEMAGSEATVVSPGRPEA